MPFPEYREPITVRQAKAMTATALALPYMPKDGTEEEQRFVGMTNMEVMYVRKIELAAGGDLDAIESVEDRMFGKPKQEVVSTSFNLTIEEFFASLPTPIEGGPSPALPSYVTDAIEARHTVTLPALATDPLVNLPPPPPTIQDDLLSGL